MGVMGTKIKLTQQILVADPVWKKNSIEIHC